VNLTLTGSSEVAGCSMSCGPVRPVISMSSKPPWRRSEASVKSCKAGTADGERLLATVDLSGVDGTCTAIPASCILDRIELSAVPMTNAHQIDQSL
jgi:hypothetical protein